LTMPAADEVTVTLPLPKLKALMASEFEVTGALTLTTTSPVTLLLAVAGATPSYSPQITALIAARPPHLVGLPKCYFIVHFHVVGIAVAALIGIISHLLAVHTS